MGTGRRVYLLGEGPSPFFIGALEKAFENYGFVRHFIERLTIEQVQSPTWKADAAVFCIPGGADKEYADKLTDKPLGSIKDFVSEGGRYLGICGGAYFASDSFVFDLLHLQSFKAMEISRDLKLFPGKAIGPDYNLQHTHLAIGVAPLSLKGSKETFTVPFHMGCSFEGVEENKFETFASYETNKPAVIKGRFKTGHVMLCGPHPELEFPAFSTLFSHATEKSTEREKVAAILQRAQTNDTARQTFFNKMIDDLLETQPSARHRVTGRENQRQLVH